MSFTQVIALAAIAIPCATALVVAHWQRKQMRQIEEYRTDPSKGLIPPPSRLQLLLRRQWMTLLMLATSMALLFLALDADAPLTKQSVFAIALSTAGGVCSLLWAAIRELMYVVGNGVSLQGRLIALVGSVVRAPSASLPTVRDEGPDA